ncbi:single-stranded DNA-binding protein [Pseudostreptobacillus sp.]
MNYVSLLGRLTRDVEVTYTQSGKAYARFSLAVSRGTSNKDEVDFINCIAWEKRAETISQYFKKGSRILVQGRITTGSYEKNGETRYTTDVVVNNFDFIETKSSEGNYGNNFSKNEPTVVDEPVDSEDDFPF